jgi:hypothetical protein
VSHIFDSFPTREAADGFAVEPNGTEEAYAHAASQFGGRYAGT